MKSFIYLGIYCCVLTTVSAQFLPAGFTLPFPFGCDLNKLNVGVEKLTQVLPLLFINPADLSFESVCGTINPLLDGTSGCLESLQSLSDLLQANLDIKAVVDVFISAQLFCGGGSASSQGLLCDFSSLVSCTLRAVDKVRFAITDDFETLCTVVSDTNTGLIKCVSDATKRCPSQMKTQLLGAVQSQVDLISTVTRYCYPGCEPVVKFLLDGYPRWSHDLDFTVKETESYCSPIQQTLDVAWGLLSECTLLTEEIKNFFIRDILSFANITGCNILLDGVPLQMSEITVLACTQASVVCARQVAAMVGVTTDLGPSGGYNIALVSNMTNEMVGHITSGQAGEICGVVKDEIWKQAMGCLDLVTNKCEATLDPTTETVIMKNTTHILSQVCSDGCIDIQRRIQQIDSCKSNVQLTLADIPMNVLTAMVTPNGADTEPCQWIRSYAKCLFDAINNCPFLHDQYHSLQDGMDKVDAVISLCKITIDLNTGDFYIGEERQSLLELYFNSGTHSGQYLFNIMLPISISIILFIGTTIWACGEYYFMNRVLDWMDM